MLSVRGRKSGKREKGRVLPHRATYGFISQKSRIPDAVQEDKVDATYKNGILKLVIPKSEGSGVKKIKIKK
jgi:HSP20 family protein